MMYFRRMLVSMAMLVIFALSGCGAPVTTSEKVDEASPKVTGALPEDQVDESDSINEENLYLNEQEKEKATARAKRMLELVDRKDLEKPAITVDGKVLTLQNIEVAKINSEYQDISLKDYIEDTIRRVVLETEAERLGVEGSPDEVDAYIASCKETGLPEWITVYNETMGVSTEEYYSELEEMMLKSTQRNNVWLKYKDAHQTEMENEAAERNLPLSEVEKEYKAKYEAQLIEDADIEILDSELKALLEK